MIRRLAPVALVSMGAIASALPEAQGDLSWGGREEHPAVVNPVMGDDEGSVVSLRGEWEFSAGSSTRVRCQSAAFVAHFRGRFVPAEA